jgi:hypothetical protein
MGNAFESQSAMSENLILTASTVFAYPMLMEIASTVSLEIPSTSSLEIEAYVDQAYVANTVGTVPDAGTAFMAERLAVNVTLPPANDFLVDELLEIGVGTVLEIPGSSSLEVLTYQSPLGLAKTASISTAETSASASYTDLATVGPQVSVTIGARGMALVTISCNASNSSTTRSNMSFAISGATTLAAADINAFTVQSFAAGAQGAGSATNLITGLNPGVNTFTAKYDTSANTGTWSFRTISVIPL